MISGLAQSEVKPREEEVFAAAMSFADEPIIGFDSVTTAASSNSAILSRKNAKRNRTNR